MFTETDFQEVFPCPWCKTNDYLEVYTEGPREWLSCRKCEAKGPSSFSGKNESFQDIKRKATSLWNKGLKK